MKTHGLYQSRIYQAWRDMKQRCNNPKNIRYNRYGGRGITYTESWEKFENFYNDMKDGYSDKLTLDRKENNKGYCKDNCKWATRDEQARNTSRTRLITHNGKTQCMKDWCNELGLNYVKVAVRITQLNWSELQALEIIKR